ncbi:MAG: hypothetical protein JWL90_1398 [Chthoniobacteraceae bacterium]|nr:hypothetical protein [Chthoniobacteraceae bacterium]
MGKQDNERKVIAESEQEWQLDGESILKAAILPDPPTPDSKATIRVTHSNVYGPFDEADIYVRLGDPKKPTEHDDLDSAPDWIKTRLVEELVFVDDEEMLRSEATEPFEDETPWDGTFDAELLIPPGKQRIEIKVLSRRPHALTSIVLTDWVIDV